MTALDDFSAAVDAFYVAAATPSRWPDALQKVADCFGDVGSLLIFRREDGAFGTIVSPDLAECAEAYEREWWRHDIRAIRAVDHGYRAQAGAITDRHVVTAEEIETHPIYTQFLVPAGLGWSAAIGIAPEGRGSMALSVQRTKTKPPFDDDELGLLTRLGRHAEHALRLSLRLMAAELASLELGRALDHVSVGVFVLDETGRVIVSNASGKALVGKGLTIVKERLTVPASDQGRFLAGLKRVAAGSIARDAKPVSLLVTGRDDQHHLVLHILPAAEGASGARLLPREASAIVLAVDPGAEAQPDPSLLRDLYGLTLGEARVASLVGAGLSPSDSAQRLGIAEATVRSTLKRVFRRVGVSRQAELTALLSRLKPPR